MQTLASLSADMSSHKAICTVLGIREEDLESRLIGAAGLLRLPATCREEVASLLMSQTLWQRPVSECESIIYSLVQNDVWRGSQFDRSIVGRMEFVADAVQQVTKHQEVTAVELEAIEKLINKLISSLLELDIPKDLKAELANRLNDIKRCLMMYRVFGNENLQQAFDALLGGYCRSQASKLDTTTMDRLRGWGVNLLEIVHHANNCISLARHSTEYIPLATTAVTALLSK